MKHTAELFIPANPIEACIHAGDIDGMLATVRAMSAQERASHRIALRKLEKSVQAARWDDKLRRWWGGEPVSGQWHCAAAALFLCGSEDDHAGMWLWDDSLFACLDLLDPGALRRLAGNMIRKRPGLFLVVQRLIVAGLSDRPDCDEYIIGLIGAARNSRAGAFPLLGITEADPGLLDGPVLRVFEVEGTGDLNMAALEKYSHSDDTTWSAAFLKWIERGHYTRAQLLGCAIGTLEKDWPQFRAGWFSRFHDRLAPTPAEMAPFAARYLGLCQSRIAPTVTLALATLGALFKSGHASADEVLGALTPVMSSAIKGQLDNALKLLDAVLKQHPEHAHAASALAQLALAHEAPEIHKKVIARLAAWGFDDATRAALVDVLGHVSAANRDALGALLGTAAPAPVPAPAPLPVRALPAPLDATRALAPLGDIDELVLAIAAILEDEREPDRFERALDALVRLRPLNDEARARLQPVLKRARKLLDSPRRDERPLAAALARFLLFASGIEIAPSGSQRNSAAAELARRIDDLIAFAGRHPGLTSLCTPTHRGGFIAPDVLAARVAAHSKAGAQSSLEEQVRALLRLASGDWPQVLAAARALPASEYAHALRYALGDDVEVGSERALFMAAARIRHPGQDDPLLRFLMPTAQGPDGACSARYTWVVESDEFEGSNYRRIAMKVSPPVNFAEEDFTAMRRHDDFWQGGESELLYGASILPSNLDAFFASGAMQIGNNLDWWEARWQDKAYLALLLDPATPVTPLAATLLAFALGAKEPSQCALAVDALVAVVLEGRLDAALLADDIRALLVSQIGKAARYAKSLASAARADPAMPHAVCALLCGVLAFGPEAPPKDCAALLELLLELSLGHGVALAPHMAATIGALALSGKGKAAQKALLAHLA